ncbi:activating transcription factor 7-interacting protein 1-like isoform X2 [Bombus flavifrons]|uniref:activating transcription factor 7-interacting protein 1-like isoform X2 n=1 Tax=Bombus flavifrons TaxID=103934 RepID=UPI003704058E
MMEALRSDILHTPDSIHSLSCINTHNIDELSKEKEEELLYSTGDDGDEEDALSDDSMRLRLSDDEIETEDILTPVLDNQENTSKTNEIEMTSTRTEDMEISSIPGKDIMNTEADIKKKEHSSDNDSDEKILIDYEKIVKKGESELMRKPRTANVSHLWQSYGSQYKYPRTANGRSFHWVNQRFRHLTPRGRYRLQYNCNTRFYNGFGPFERGRGNGIFHSHRSIYGDRRQKKGFSSNAMHKQNSSTESDVSPISPSNKNISLEAEVNDDIETIKLDNDATIDGDSMLCSKSVINSDKNDHSNESLSEKVENAPIKNIRKENSVNTDSVNNSLELKHDLEENTKIKVSNDPECKNTTIHTLNDNSSENPLNSETDFHNDNNSKQKVEISKNDMNNANIDFSDFRNSNNFKVEALNIDIKCKSGKDETIKYTEGKSNQEQYKSINNEEQDKITKITDIKCKSDKDEAIKYTEEKSNQEQYKSINNEEPNKITKITDTNKSTEIKEVYKLEEQDLNRNKKLTELSQEIELSGNNCKTTVLNSLEEKEIVNNDIILNGKVTNYKTDEILRDKKKKISSEDMKSNEDYENSEFKSTTVLNNVTSNKNGNVPEKTVIKSVKCDNQLKSSDNSTNSIEISKSNASENQLTRPIIDLWEQNEDVTEKDIKTTEKENSIISSASKKNLSEHIELMSDKNSLPSVELEPSVITENDSLDFVTNTKNNSDDSDKRTVEVPVTTQRRKKRSKRENVVVEQMNCTEEKQVRESGRRKRRTAKNAEEIIRTKFLHSDVESSDDSEKFVAINFKMNQDARPSSPPSLKRTCSDTDTPVMNGGVKKIKANFEERCNELKTQENNSDNIKNLNYIHKFFQRDLNEKLPKLKQEELEELLIQKIVETITMRDEIGKLREQARISEKNQEVTRAKCQQLAKQIKDFEMVLNRNAADRRASNDKFSPPIKINRSVGLQVNFVTDHVMQNLRQLQQNSNMKSLHVSSSNNASNTSVNETNNATSPRRGIKTRSPRKTEPITGQTSVVAQSHTQSPNIMTTITPAALVVAKPLDSQHPLTLSNQSNVQQIISNQQIQPQQSQQAIILNGKFPNQINRQGSTTTNVAKSRANDLIDLTDEEEKSKATTGVPVVTTTVTDQQVNLTQKTQQPCFQRVIQTIPGNVAITSQPPSIRVVQPASQPTPTALVNNMNAPRLAYVMPTRQLLITPNSSPMRPVTSCRASFPTLTYKTGISTIANGTVRFLTTPATSNVQLNKHPAPLPDTRNYAVNPLWKLSPPAPSLKISKVAHGIVLSWNMNLSDKYADIVSYQLYAYQEIAGVPPNTSLWKKVGDVRALPLPMACTLTQFSEGNNYHFAVRAVDIHSRKGQYSIPGNISL